MSQALYRKYRPQTFAEVIGQPVITRILKNSLISGRISHGYLFTGPRGVGKTTVARVLAKAVNCLALKDGEPDTSCRNCELLQSGRFLDLIEIDAASYTGVDNIREIIDHVRFSPSLGRYKVFIIDEVHMLSKAAFNALLKTLEEPPQHAIFILATTEAQKVPATIISRSQRFDFRRISDREIIGVLDAVLQDLAIEMEPPAKYLLARAAEGSLRDALSILDQLTSLGGPKLSLSEVEEILGATRVEASQKFLAFLVAGRRAEACQFIRDLVLEGKDPVLFLKNFLEYLRLVLMIKLGAQHSDDLGFDEDEAVRLARQAKLVSAPRLFDVIKKFLESYRDAKVSPVPELPILAQILALDEGPAVPTARSEADISRPAKPPLEANSDPDMGMIVDRWAEVLLKVKDYNHSLLSSLRLGRIVRVAGLEIYLAFPYNFHKETLEARKNKIVVEQVLEDVFGKALKVKILLERELAQDAAARPVKQDLLEEAVKILGGDPKNF